jgi:hypothetical protein
LEFLCELYCDEWIHEHQESKNPQVFLEEESDRESTPAKNCDKKAKSLEAEGEGF